MSFSWGQLAKGAEKALKQAQKKIDSVLDIQEDDDEQQQDAVLDVDVALVPDVDADAQASPAPASSSVTPAEHNNEKDRFALSGSMSESQQVAAVSPEGQWGWESAYADPGVVVDSEPNPIRDDAPPAAGLLQHSPASNSPDEAETEEHPHRREPEEEAVEEKEKQSEEEDGLVEVDLYVDVESVASEGVREGEREQETPLDNHDPVPMEIDDNRVLVEEQAQSRRGSHHDDTLTVASSDIEVIRNVDAWSIASSVAKKADHLSMSVVIDKASAEEVDSLRAQLRHNEQRMEELKKATQDAKHSNTQLQQRVVTLNQQHSSLKKSLESKEKELVDLLEEGKRLSDHSGKQSREIRRLKAQVADVEKIKAERKKLKEEKAASEETVQLQQEELQQLKGMVKTLEDSSRQAEQEKHLSVASNEVVQKHVDDQEKRLAELTAELHKNKQLVEQLTLEKQDLRSELDVALSSKYAEKIAEERAVESAATAGRELQEAFAQIHYLREQLEHAEQKLDDAQHERSDIAGVVAQANAPLLEEICELKSCLLSEQVQSEEREAELKTSRKQLAALQTELDKARGEECARAERWKEETRQLYARQTHLEQECDKLRAQCAAEVDGWRKQRLADAARLDELIQEKDRLRDECAQLRNAMKEFKDENDVLKKRLEEGGRVAEERQLIRKETTPAHEMPRADSSLQEESRRLVLAENEAAQLRERLSALQIRIKDMERQYNQLLELDGERMETIEEQQADIDDLRELLRQQQLEFATTASRFSSPQ